MIAVDPRSRTWVPGRFAFVTLATLYAILAVGALPLLSREGFRDWWTFARAADNLRAGQPLYFDDAGVIINLYPPAMALLWTWGMTSGLWLVIAVISIPASGLLGRGWERAAIPVLFALQPAVLYDLLLGNVTVLLVAAICVRLTVRGMLGGLPLGIMLALAPKPALVPLLLVLLVRARRDAFEVIALAAGISLATVALVGDVAVTDFVRALLDSQRQLAGWVTGNLGLARAGTIATIAGIGVGLVATLVSARTFTLPGAVAVGLACGVLVQPTLGFYYSVLLAPGVVLLWQQHRLAGYFAAIAVPLASFVTPVLGGLILLSLVVAVEVRRSRPQWLQGLTARAVGGKGREAAPGAEAQPELRQTAVVTQ